MADEFIVESAISERLYVKTYHDFLDSELLSGKEKLVFILLKRYLNFKDDYGGVAGKVYPTLETLSKQAGMTKKTVADIIKKLEKKGIIEVKQQGLNRPNIYSLRDFRGIWIAKTDDEARAAIDTYNEEYEDSLLIERLRNKGYTVIKEKEPETSADQSIDDSSTKKNHIHKNNDKLEKEKSQVQERYSMNDIEELFEYRVMMADFPEQQKDIEAVMAILHTCLNTGKDTIRVGGEDKPSMTVIGKLMKLGCSEIMYSIRKYQEQTEKIKNPTAYMLTLLYKSKEQMNLDITNQFGMN